MSYLIRQLKVFFYALTAIMQDAWDAVAGALNSAWTLVIMFIPLPYLAILAYIIVAIWQGWLAWRRHPDSSLARVEGCKTYVAKWALYRWLFYLGFFLLLFLQEATWGFFAGCEKFKFNRLVSQVDLAIHNGQLDAHDGDKGKPNAARRIFYESD